MPRRSAASLSVAPVPIRHEAPRLAVPAHLETDAAVIWRATVGALPADYFRREVAPTLERYCINVARCRRLEQAIAEVDPATDLDAYERLVKLVRCEAAAAAAMARSLRITNQSRHAVTLGRMAGTAPPARTPEDDRRAVAELVAARRAER